MTIHLERDALNVILPTSTTKIAVPASASTTAGVTGQNLAALAGKYVWMKSTVKTHIRAGATPTGAGAATTDDIYLTADVDYFWRIPQDGSRNGIRVKGAGTAGTLYYAVTSGPL